MKLRKLLVAGETYYWRRTSRRLARYEASPWAVEVVAYREGHRKSPLRLLFKEDDNQLVTNNAQPGKWLLHGVAAGWCWFAAEAPQQAGESVARINFNRPAVIARLLTFFLAQGWQPATTSRPLAIEDALRYINALQLPVEQAC